jgi:hypothetical protein
VLPTSASRRRHVALLVAGCLAIALGFAAVTPAVAGKPSGGGTVLPVPSSIVVVAVTSDFTRGTAFPGDALPSVVVQAGGTLTVDVRFQDANGAAAAFKKDTALRIATNVGTLSSTTGKALKGQSTAQITTSVTSVVNRVVLTVSAPAAATVPSPGSSVTFDVLSEIRPNIPATSGSAFEAGIGANADCVSAEPATPVCGIVRLPRGSSTNVLLSVGACDVDPDPVAPYAPCYEGPNGPGGAVVQSLFTQPAVPYSIGSPATIVLKCDKTLCGTGSIQGLTVLFSLNGNDPLGAPEACPAKGVMATPGEPCVDYVQSKRDGSGDTHLFLLTDRDIRTGIG